MGVKAETAEDALLMAYASYKQNNFQRMLLHAQEALKLRPDFPLSLHYQALALRGLGDFTGAEQAVRSAMSKDKNNFHHVFLLGIIMWNSGDMRSAEDFLKKAVSTLSKEPTFLVEYATYLIHRGRFDEALDFAYRARSIDENTPKLKLVIESAKSKEIGKGLDLLVYEPPFPYSPDLIFPYLKLGEYYLKNDYLPNSQMEYLKALKIDSNNPEARSGFATATRLQEGGFYHFSRSFALFLRKPYVYGVILALVLFLVVVSLRDQQFIMMPLLMIAGGLVAMTSFFLITGLPDKGAGEYKKILNEWNVKDLSSIPAKIAEISSELEKQRRQEDAIVSKSKMLLSYSNIFSLVFWISLLSLAGLVNIDVNTIFDVDTVDAIETTKWIMLGILVASIGLALWLRSKSKAVLRENAADRANGVPAKANGTAGKSGGASGKAAK
jgi:tetratricopeptide (TPR) repeat protein